MTSEEAVWTLQEAVDEAFGAGIEIITRDGCEAIEMAIKALQERKTGEWIAFKDEQPQVNVSVLICDVDGDIYISHRTMSDTYYDETGNWLKNLRAWMPLPEPYKEVDE